MSVKNTTSPVSSPVSPKGKKAEPKNLVIAESAPVSVIESPIVETSDSIPAEKKPFGRILGSKGEFGFGEGTITGAILSALESGKFTRKALTESILNEFAGSDEAKRKAVKTTLSVTLSDVKRPFGTYFASRSLLIFEETGTGLLSLEPERSALVKAAIKGGILASLRGKTTSAKKAIIAGFGLPTE